ncbi:DEAD/DEAH box helicase [Aegicerativicinus sediminis]|uniref:hypothetical protein n=1 Tax=Aegicerativicinus sediminis TaxID=2893202 RepID=UPI001E457995|nr:hypothetical protein [Aegicerativicinus sediminis]
MFKPRPYQVEISDKAASILKALKIVLLNIEVRCGKTFISLMTAQKLGSTKVLFVTKKKAIHSIQADYDTLSPAYAITIINFESLHKVSDTYDLIIIDESHSISAYPKPSKRTKALKNLVGDTPLILMSGTITPESWSQIYHQFWISNNSPFNESNFYGWAHTYVDVKKRYVAHGNQVNDYSRADYSLIRPIIDPYMITFTQREAGFTSTINEQIHQVKMKPTTYKLVETLESDLVYVGKHSTILADTPTKLLSKIHQIYSGTVICEEGRSAVIDNSKGIYIKEEFKGIKIAIFYKFQKELELLQDIFKDQLTTDLQEFNSTHKNIALQIASGREGISLKAAEALVMYNIDHAAVSYWQARDRMSTQDRLTNNVHWIFSKNGIEHNIYETVLKKRNFTTKHYEQTRKNGAVLRLAI